MKSGDISNQLSIRHISDEDAPLLHTLYRCCPDYFERISFEVPTLHDVSHELASATNNPRLVYAFIVGKTNFSETCSMDKKTGKTVLGLIVYTSNHPVEGGILINLMLIIPTMRNKGLGGTVLKLLESELGYTYQNIYADVYGGSKTSKSFWTKNGFQLHANDIPASTRYIKCL